MSQVDTECNFNQVTLQKSKWIHKKCKNLNCLRFRVLWKHVALWGEIKDCPSMRDIPWFRRKHRGIPVTFNNSLNVLKSSVCLDVLMQLQLFWSTIFKRRSKQGIWRCLRGPGGHLKCWKTVSVAIVLKEESFRKD